MSLRGRRPSPWGLVDVPLVVSYVVLAWLVAWHASGSLAEGVLVPLLVLLPGYAVLAALFPRGPPERDPRRRRPTADAVRSGGMGWRERVAFSVPLSLATLPLVSFGLAALDIPFARRSVFASLATLVLAGTLLGLLFRLRLPSGQRYDVPAGVWRLGRRRDRGRTADTVITLGVLVFVVMAMTTVGYGLVTATRGADTGATLLTERGGQYVAGGYPTDLVVGEPTPLAVEIRNGADRPVEYTVVVALERVEHALGAPNVVDRRELDRLSPTVRPGGTHRVEHAVTPTVAGTDLRLSYYVYAGSPPGEVSPESARRHLSLWVTVAEPADSPDAGGIDAGGTDSDETDADGTDSDETETDETDANETETDGAETDGRPNRGDGAD